MEWHVHQLEELIPVAKYVANHLQHKILLLKGDMGAGKTTFIKDLVKEMQSEDIVNSPTYALVNTYHSKKGKIYHFDFYRINHEEEAYDIGLEEYLDSEAFCFIEWFEKIPGFIPENYHILEIRKINDTHRIISFQ